MIICVELEPFENSWTRNPLTGRKLFEGDIAGVTNKRRVYGNNPSRRVKGLVVRRFYNMFVIITALISIIFS